VARRSGHQAVVVTDEAGVQDQILGGSFVGAMSLGVDVVQGALRLQATGHGVRQDLTLVASDGAQTTWQQVCTMRRDTVDVELVRLDPSSERGKGRGLLAYRNFLLWCDLAGVQRVALEAGKSVGGYFWARCGFLPDAESWETLCAGWRRQAQRAHADDLLALLEAVEPVGPEGIVLIARSDFGHSLLPHARWRGLLDLTNPEQCDRARQYAVPS
jgi:hypothetical protein